MDPKSIDAIQKALVPVANALGKTGAELWRILVQQARIEAVTDAVWSVVLFAAFIISVVFIWRHRQKWGKMDDFEKSLCLVLTSILASILLFVSLLLATGSIHAFANPEFRAIQVLTNEFAEHRNK